MTAKKKQHWPFNYAEMIELFEHLPPKLAKLVMQKYREANPGADANIGYILGYFPTITRRKMERKIGVKHPIFG